MSEAAPSGGCPYPRRDAASPGCPVTWGRVSHDIRDRRDEGLPWTDDAWWM